MWKKLFLNKLNLLAKSGEISESVMTWEFENNWTKQVDIELTQMTELTMVLARLEM